MRVNSVSDGDEKSKGAAIYDVRVLTRGGRGYPKSGQMEQNQLISVHVKGGKGEKFRNFCRRHI